MVILLLLIVWNARTRHVDVYMVGPWIWTCLRVGVGGIGSLHIHAKISSETINKLSHYFPHRWHITAGFDGFGILSCTFSLWRFKSLPDLKLFSHWTQGNGRLSECTCMNNGDVAPFQHYMIIQWSKQLSKWSYFSDLCWFYRYENDVPTRDIEAISKKKKESCMTSPAACVLRGSFSKLFRIFDKVAKLCSSVPSDVPPSQKQLHWRCLLDLRFFLLPPDLLDSDV